MLIFKILAMLAQALIILITLETVFSEDAEGYMTSSKLAFLLCLAIPFVYIFLN